MPENEGKSHTFRKCNVCLKMPFSDKKKEVYSASILGLKHPIKLHPISRFVRLPFIMENVLFIDDYLALFGQVLFSTASLCLSVSVSVSLYHIS